MTPLERCEAEIGACERGDYGEAELWCYLLGWADWQKEKHLLQMERLKPMLSHKSWEWPTPKVLYEELDREFHFDFDPCPIGGTDDGRSPLFVSWNGKRVFCNPPYGPEIRKFLERAFDAELAVFLVPARTDTRWFHEIVLPKAREIRFIKGRLKFGDSKNSAPFPSMVVVFAKE